VFLLYKRLAQFQHATHLIHIKAVFVVAHPAFSTGILTGIYDTLSNESFARPEPKRARLKCAW
jgi:hypothetical protein